MAIDYFVQVSLTTQIILSHDDNQTKIVTNANTINIRITTAGGSRIRLQNVPTYINSSASDNQLLHSFSCDTHFYPGWPIFPCHFARAAAAKKII